MNYYVEVVFTFAGIVMSGELVFVVALAACVSGGLMGFVVGGAMSISRERRIYRRGRVDGLREAAARQNPNSSFGQLLSLHKQYARRIK